VAGEPIDQVASDLEDLATDVWPPECPPRSESN
jgi:hypothetical protein